MLDNETIHEARKKATRKLFGHALSYAPGEVYEATHTPIPNKLAGFATQHVLASARRNKVIDYINKSTDVSTYLFAGIDDVRSILESTLKDRPEASKETALRIATHPETALAIAHLALRNESAPPEYKRKDIEAYASLTNIIARRFKMNTLTTPGGKIEYDIDATATHIAVNTALVTPQQGGCPFAGQNAEVRPEPLFARFTAWAGELAVHSIYDHK